MPPEEVFAAAGSLGREKVVGIQGGTESNIGCTTEMQTNER